MFSNGVLGLLVIGLIIGAMCACAMADRITRAQGRRASQKWDDLVSSHQQLDLELEEIWRRP